MVIQNSGTSMSKAADHYIQAIKGEPTFSDPLLAVVAAGEGSEEIFQVE
jgi:hypothetical protein